jgi:hypothetical protein
MRILNSTLLICGLSVQVYALAEGIPPVKSSAPRLGHEAQVGFTPINVGKPDRRVGGATRKPMEVSVHSDQLQDENSLVSAPSESNPMVTGPKKSMP